MKKLLASAATSASFLAFPVVAFAQTSINPCANNPSAPQCAIAAPAGFGILIGNIVNFVFVLAVLVALGFLIWGGFKWLTSGGDKEGVENARNTIIAAIVGLIIIFLSYVILNLVLTFLTGQGISALTLNPITTGL